MTQIPRKNDSYVEALDREKIVVYTLGWHDDHEATEHIGEDEPNASIYCRVFIDGRELRCVVSSSIKHSSDFTTVVMEMSPASYRIVECTGEEWARLGRGEDIDR